MQKVLRILSRIPHRFIVSKGVIGHEYDSLMADNMHGENWLNQLSVLQTVEIIITHGGVSLESGLLLIKVNKLMKAS